MPNTFQRHARVIFALLPMGASFTIKHGATEVFTKIEERMYDARPDTVCNGKSLTDGKLWKFNDDLRVYPVSTLVDVVDVKEVE